MAAPQRSGETIPQRLYNQFGTTAVGQKHKTSGNGCVIMIQVAQLSQNRAAGYVSFSSPHLHSPHLPPQKKNSSNLGASHKWPLSGLRGGVRTPEPPAQRCPRDI